MSSLDITFCSNTKCKNKKCERNQIRLNELDYKINHIWCGDFKNCEFLEVKDE